MLRPRDLRDLETRGPEAVVLECSLRARRITRFVTFTTPSAPHMINPHSYSEFCSFANLTESSVILSSVITKLSRLKKGLSQDVEDNTDNIQG